MAKATVSDRVRRQAQRDRADGVTTAATDALTVHEIKTGPAGPVARR